MCEGDTRVVFVKSNLICGGCCRTSKDYDRAANETGISRLGLVKYLSRE